MQKESAQSDHPARRKRPKCGPILLFQNIQIFMNVLDVFSGQGDLIELIPCALCQASREPEKVPLLLEFHFDAYKGGSNHTTVFLEKASPVKKYKLFKQIRILFIIFTETRAVTF